MIDITKDEISIVLVFVLSLLVIIVLGHAFGLTNNRSRIVKRAMATRTRYIAPLHGKSAEGPQLRRENKQSSFDSIALRLLPRPDYWRKELQRAGAQISLGAFFLIATLFSVGAGFGLLEAGLRAVYAWPLGMLAGIFGPRLIVNYLINRRMSKFVGILPDAIGLMVRGLRSGRPLTETLASVGTEIGDPLGPEFRQIADEIQLGRPLEEVLSEAAERTDRPEFTFMVIAFNIQRETGGNLVETLGNLEQLLRRRRQMQLKVRSFSAEARTSAWIIGSMPFVLMALLFAIQREYIMTLFTTDTGHTFLMAAGVSMMMGAGVLAKLTRFDI